MLLTLCVGLASCAKNPEISDKSKEMVPVSFKVGFSKEVTNFRSLSTPGPVSSRSGGDVTITKLDYLVYDAVAGKLYKSLKKYNFTGTLSDELPEGEYYVIFVGSMFNGYNEEFYNPWDHDVIKMGNTENKLITAEFPSWEGQMLNENAWGDEIALPSFHILHKFKEGGDVFYAKYNLVVEEDATTAKEIELNRIVGKVEFVIEDAIPENVVSITLSSGHYSQYHVIPGSFLYNTTSEVAAAGSPENYSFIEHSSVIESSKVGTTGHTISFISFENCDANQTYYPFSLTLTARKALPEGVIDNGQATIAEKTISGINIIKNKTVIYRGNLFDGTIEEPGNGDASFDLSVNNEWEEVIELDFEGNILP